MNSNLVHDELNQANVNIDNAHKISNAGVNMADRADLTNDLLVKNAMLDEERLL